MIALGAFQRPILLTAAIYGGVVLVSSGCQPGRPDASLWEAAEAGDVEQIEANVFWMRKNGDFDVEIRDDAGETPLHKAARMGCLGAVATLIDAGANVHARNTQRQTPLILACSDEFLDRSIERIVASIDFTDLDNPVVDQPAPAACKEEFVEVVKILLAAGATASINAEDDRHRTALSLVGAKGPIRDLLLAGGARERIENDTSGGQGASKFARSHPRNFRGYACTDDCSGHKAGYEWAHEKEIANASDCANPSESFAEGCRIYLEEQTRGFDRGFVEPGPDESDLLP
jgi:hypothetical protein